MSVIWIQTSGHIAWCQQKSKLKLVKPLHFMVNTERNSGFCHISHIMWRKKKMQQKYIQVKVVLNVMQEWDDYYG